MASTETLLNHWIEGREEGSRSGRHGEVTNSATGQVVSRVPFADAEEVDAAVQAAVAAAPSWESASLSERTRIMFAFRELLHARREEMASVITLEHGKVTADALGEVQRELELVEFACGLAEQLKGEHSWQVSRGIDSYTLRQPLGVVAGITPFNFPSMVPGWMFPLAIASGNTFVLKPSEQDPSASMMLGDMLATQSGAIVTAPADGNVLYAGPFRSYGQLLILNAGDGYHVVLAGMSRISVASGQSVLAGEPVGAMGEARVASTSVSKNGNATPELYVEFRKDGKPVDPAPWWADRFSGRT